MAQNVVQFLTFAFAHNDRRPAEAKERNGEKCGCGSVTKIPKAMGMSI